MIKIGLEIHVELRTDTKLFCSCPTQGSEEPNSRCCPVCLGHPGSKPVTNKKAIVYATKLAKSLNCSLAKEIRFSRKSYFYPDMSKNYQITQYEVPLGKKGHIMLDKKKIRIKRVHLEEDPASLVHPKGVFDSDFVLIDYNRSGNPLCEVVTDPDLKSPGEARDFMKKLITILMYLKIFDPKINLIKADANVSVKESNFTRVEIKNISGFKEIEKALTYEIDRQGQAISNNNNITQETRGWDSEKSRTYLLRKKETEDDYGYIIDPDLVAITVDDSVCIPEMPDEKYQRYIKDYKIAKDDANVITSDPILAEIFEDCIKKLSPILAARWIRKELISVLNYNKIEPNETVLNTQHFIDMLVLLQNKKITEKVATKILRELIIKDFDVDEYVKKNDLLAESDSGKIQELCKEAISENPRAVSDFKAGKENALNFVVGQVMRKSKGKAEPKGVLEILKRLV